ncbi:hypothetical protein PUR_16830 [Paenibacillus sp. URB8-2]|nr:hypothetical protein PUR_16830 [Paenibacillus sp. URB8-2]
MVRYLSLLDNWLVYCCLHDREKYNKYLECYFKGMSYRETIELIYRKYSI